MAEMTIEQQRALALARARAQAATASDKSYTGQILPFSVDAEGNKHFDSNAGVLGAVKRAFMLPGEVYSGKEQVFGPDGEVRPEMIGRSLEFASTFGPATPGINSGDYIIPGEKTSFQKVAPPAPTAEALRGAAKQGYDDAAALGVEYSPQAVKDLAAQIGVNLDQEGLIGKVAPKTRSILDDLANPPADAVSAPLSGVEAARRSFGKVGQDYANPPEQLASGVVRDALDKFMRNPPEDSVLAGDASLAAQLQREADKNYAAFKRSSSLADLERAAEIRAESVNSGQNTANAIRQRIASLLLNPKQAGRFNDEELALLREVSGGTPTANATRFIGNLMGGGGGMGAVVSGGVAGAAAGGAAGDALTGVAVGAGVPAVGIGMKKISEYLTRKALDEADTATRMRSPLYQKLLEDAPSEVTRKSGTEALIRLLMATESGRNAGGGW